MGALATPIGSPPAVPATTDPTPEADAANAGAAGAAGRVTARGSTAGTPIARGGPAHRQAPSVTLAGVSKRHGTGQTAQTALVDVNLAVEPGQFVCLVGASGCGKTTLLNLVAGLDRPTSGSLSVTTGDAGQTERTVGMLFQDSALFPWLTVAANVELPLRLRGMGRTERRSVASDLLERVHLGGLGGKRPHELSGGMRQRAALARALAQDAGLLLMDEPFGALDAITRDLLHDELEGLWVDRGFSVLFVTHNVREAARLGDTIVLLTSRPGTVAAIFPVDFPRPRRIDSPEVARLAATVTDQLRAEVGRHGR